MQKPSITGEAVKSTFLKSYCLVDGGIPRTKRTRPQHGIDRGQRSSKAHRHIGKSGVGKTTLIRNMVLCDLEAGNGLTVIDPHGSLVEDILDSIPRHRTNDVIYLNPADPFRVIGLNVLEAVSQKFSKRFENKHGVQQARCVHLGNCVIGCDVLAKNTLDLNYIPRAQRAGAEVRPLHMVRKIAPEENGYRVFYERIDVRAKKLLPGSVSSRLVVVACGSLGSTELLLRCRNEFKTLPNISPFLGHNWSSNGDVLTPAIHTGTHVSPTHGPTISAAIDFVERPLNGEYFFIEDGGFPNVLGSWLRQNPDPSGRDPLVKAFLEFVRQFLRSGDTTTSVDDPFRAVMPWFAQGVDYADGRLELRRPWWLLGKRRLHLKWDIRESERTINANNRDAQAPRPGN